MTEITDSPDITQWSEFVYNHPQGNIFQTPELAEVIYKRTKNYEPISLAAINEDTKKILGILQAVVTKEMKGILAHRRGEMIVFVHVWRVCKT